MPTNKILLGFLLISICLIFKLDAAEAAKTPRPHSLAELVKLPGARNAQISPDGKHFSVVFRAKTQEKLAIFNIATMKPTGIFHVRGLRRSVGQVNWVNNERLVYGVEESYSNDKALRNTGELFGVNLDGEKHKALFGLNIYNKQTGSRIKKQQADKGSHEIIDLLEGDDENILIVFYPWTSKGGYWRTNHNVKASVHKLNVYSGRKNLVTKLNLPGAWGITDSKGQVRFSVGTNNKNRSVVSYRDNQSDEWKDFSLDDFPGTNVFPLSFAEDDNSVYLSANIDGGTRGLFKFNLADKSFVKEFHDPVVDMTLRIRDFSGKQVIAVGTELGLPTYKYLVPKNRKVKLHKSLVKAFPKYDILITSSSRDGEWNIVYAYSDRNSGDFYLFNSKSMDARHLFAKSSWLDPELMAEMNPVTVKTRDGNDIHGYLTRPKSASKNLPLVVIPHGGPHGVRDYWGYDWETQILANSGYAVLQINYRGSGGYGLAFKEAGHGQWGTLMQDDLTDATLAMIENGVADKSRICIYGSSYGGYAALMGAVREPDLYKCAIGSMGVYDLPMMFKEGDVRTRKSGLSYLRDVLGNDIEDQKRRSPVYNVDKIKANILLIHGAKDERAPIEHAESLKDAFDDINKKYEWLELDDEGHGYYDEENRFVVYTKILEFLKANLSK